MVHLTTISESLPKGWVWTTLEEISEIILGQSPPSSTYNTTGEGLPFYQGKLEFGKIYPTPRKWCTAPKKIAEKGDVFISIRAPVGPTNLCPETSAVGRGLAAIRGLGGIESFFILHLMRAYANEIASRGTGTTFDAITGNQLKTFEIPLPPLAEQRRIVAKLEMLFTQLDAAVDSLKKAQIQVQRYRQSVLKAAFEGELTTEWREGHSDKLEPMSVLENSTLNNLPDLPDGWVWTQVKHIAEFLRGVSYRKNQSSKTPKDDYIPILRANNINAQLNFEDLVYVEQNKVKNEQLVKALDIIIAMSSGSKHLVGKAAQAAQDFEGGFGTFCGLVRVSEEVNKKFIGLFFQSPIYRNEISSLSIGININNLRRENIETMPIPIPSLPEQEQIVSELERYLSVTDEVEATLDAELKRAERLRQSILKHAFSGKLVPQDPNDEPASVLLEKIRGEEKRTQLKKQQNAKSKSKTRDSNDTLLLTPAGTLESNVADTSECHEEYIGNAIQPELWENSDK